MKKIVNLCLCGILLISTTGCWSEREVEKLAVVTIAGFDQVTVDGQEQYRITDRVLNPHSGKGSTDPASQNDDILVTGTGSTLQETSREATLRTPRQPYFGQMEAVIVGESLAKEGMEQVVELLGRYPEARLRPFIMVAKGSAYDVLKSKPEMDKTLSREIIDLADNKNLKLGVTCSCDLNKFFQSLLADDISATTGVIEKTKSPTTNEDRVNLVGMAAFRKDKLVGYLNIEETMGALMLWNRFNNCRTPIAISRSDKEKFTYLLRSDKCKIVPEVQDDTVHYKINVETTGDVDDLTGIEITPENIPGLEDEVEKRISGIVQDTISRAQNLNSDFIGFAYWLHRKDPKAWQSWKSKWDQAFPDVTYEISVTSNIANNGQLTKNIQVDY